MTTKRKKTDRINRPAPKQSLKDALRKQTQASRGTFSTGNKKYRSRSKVRVGGG